MSDPAHIYRQFEDVIRLRPKNDQISVSYISKIEELASELGENSTSQKYQKIQWELLRARISYQINRLDVHNIQEVVRELFKLNLQRGRGVLVRSLMKWQLYDTRYAELFASLIAVINSYIPAVGELLCSRLVLQFRKAYLNNNRKVCVASTIFLGYLTNQRVVSEILILQIIQLLMANPSNDTIAITCEIMKVTGQTLAKISALASNTIFSKLREMLRDNTQINARSHLNIDIALKAQRNHFKDYPALPKALDLVEEEDQETHTIELYSAHSAHDNLNVYQYDPAYQQNEEEYAQLSHEILDNEEDARAEPEAAAAEPVIDLTETDLLQYQKTVYLKVMSSMSADEAVHKLLKMNFGEKGDKNEILADMIVKCCSQEKTYSKYFGVIGEKLCSTNRHWHDVFVRLFKKYYKLVDSLEINSLRNVGKFFGHLFASDKLAIDQGWDEIKITEADTTSAGRILLKFIFQEMVEELGIKEVTDRLIHDNYVKKSINGVFPVVDVDATDADNIRFSINFFTAIGLGVLTEEMRSVLANLPEARGRGSDRGSSRSSSRSYSRSSGSYSRSRSSSSGRSYSRSSGSYSRSRSRSYSRSRSNSRSRSGSETGNKSPTQESSRTAPNPGNH